VAGGFDDEFVAYFADADIGERSEADAGRELAHVGGDPVASFEAVRSSGGREGELVDGVGSVHLHPASNVSGLEIFDCAREPRRQGGGEGHGFL